MDWMVDDGYGKVKEKAQHREELNRWTFGHSGRQITWSAQASTTLYIVGH